MQSILQRLASSSVMSKVRGVTTCLVSSRSYQPVLSTHTTNMSNTPSGVLLQSYQLSTTCCRTYASFINQPQRSPFGLWSTQACFGEKTLLWPCGNMTVDQMRGYKVKVALRKRCPKCYFVRRKGRWYVECKAKPRHKQMQKVAKHLLFRED